MKKFYRESIHYAILAVILTATVFLAHAFSGFIEVMTTSTLQPLVILGWTFLFLWYLLFLTIALVVTDLILHKSLSI